MNYTESNRGTIQERERARQIIDYSGIRCNTITPTDIDGFIDYRNTAFIFYEMKYAGARMPRGQRVAYERIIDSLFAQGKFAILFCCDHNVSNPEQDIDAATTTVRSIYMGGNKWIDGNGMSAKQATDAWIDYATTHIHPINQGVIVCD